jgi:phenylacetaldehyde dehydrogenase
VLQLLHGDGATGARLVADPGIAAVSFTGGLGGGRAVASACAEGIKPAQLELGGNNALVVLDDADIEAAADGIVAGLTTLNGQWCRAIGRLLVHESLQQQLLDAVCRRLSALHMGAALDPQAEMGPLVHEGHRQHVAAAVDALAAKGAQVLQPTALPDLGGWFFAPTLLTGLDPEHSRDEIFGPVCAVHSFGDDAEACRLASETPFGLAGYVFGSEQRAWSVARTMRCGIVKINGVSMLNLNPAAPRPAWGLSGIGDEGTRETFEFFRGSRVIGVAARPAS